MSIATLDEIEVDAEAEAEARKAREQARNERVVENMGLVGRVAKLFLIPGRDMEDLVQDGAIGLIHAVEDFDEARGYRFSTYANYWIRAVILREVAKRSHAIRVPESARDLERPVVVGLDPELLSDVAVAPDGEDPDTGLLSDRREWLRSTTEKLSPRERRILQLRYPADDSEPATLEQVAREMGITTERVRQIQTRAIARLRQLARLSSHPRSLESRP